MTAVAIQGTFKKDESQWDGLAPHVEDLIKNPHSPVIVVAICEVVEIKERPQDGTHQPKIKIKHIERATEGDAIRVSEMINRVYNARTGRTDSQPTLFDADPQQGDPEQPDLVQSDWPGVDVDGAGDAWANDGEQPPEQTAEGGEPLGGLPEDAAPTEQPKRGRGRPRKSTPPAAAFSGEVPPRYPDPGADPTAALPPLTADTSSVPGHSTFQTAEGAPDLGDDPDGDNSPDDVPWPGDVDHPDTAPEG